MKLKDIQEIHEAGLISEDQRRSIIDHFHLEHPRNRFLKVLVTLGGTLVLTGIILVISANWDAIPGWLKIAAGALLMMAAHFTGWKLRCPKEYSKLSEVFHFIGAGLFLANIALVGQVYHLSSRTPNALLLWLIGIIPLVWILRSVAIHVLTLGGLLVWLGTEINSRDGWFHFAENLNQFGVYGGVGLLLYGCGLKLKRTSYHQLALPTEIIGMASLHFGLWPLVTIGNTHESPSALLLMLVPAVAGLGLIAAQLRHLPDLTAQWRRCWLAVLAGWITVAAFWMLLDFGERGYLLFGHMGVGQAFASIALVTGCIVQMRVAEDLRAPWLVNLAIVTTGYCIILTFALLVGSMMNTGLIFLVGGAGILGLGYWLEKKRRAVILRMKA
jgi:hypothetical protein